MDLRTIFHIGRERVFGEHYEAMVAGALKEFQIGSHRWESVHHVMTKTNLLDNVVKGAREIGRPSLASTLRALRPETP